MSQRPWGPSMSSDSASGRRVGVYIDLGETLADGGKASWADIRTMATEAERIGCDSVWLPDRLQVGDVGVWESLSMVSAIAAVTSRVTIGTAVTRSIYRHPTLLAKMAETIDEISGGRFILGLGAGSNQGDNREFGFPTDHAISRFEEALSITHALLRTGSVTYDGRYYEVRDTPLRPRGPRQSGPPIMVAARRPRMMRLAARYADSWTSLTLANSPDEWQEQLAAIATACAEEGRDPATLGKVAAVLVTQLPDVEHPYGPALSGEPGQVAATINDFFESGFDEVILYPAPNSPSAIAALEPVVAALRG
jgi:alkanesulfonate monooxygenase SsuD/methylene tetrahydromethanopterin reductase-like flavin-dependent oxidoreductase (luciferase family)